MARHLALLVVVVVDPHAQRDPSATCQSGARMSAALKRRWFKVPREIGIPALRIAFSTR